MDNLDKIFKAYDVRGKYPSEVNEEIGYKIGQAAAKFLKAKELIIGQDNRLSSKNLAKVVIEGIRDQGINVIDIGLSTTPMFYFAAVKFKADGGIMITASHNPPEYNGFKIIRNKAMPVGQDSGLNKIKNLVKRNKFKTINKRGVIEKRNVLKSYINHIFDFVHTKNIKPFKIIIDTGKGVANLIAQELFKNVSGKSIHISSDFLNPKNTEKTEKKVLLEKADLGVAFDGDGDRIVFINEKYQRIHPDLIAALLIHHYFKNTGEILCTSVSSRNLKEEIRESNNNLVISKVGHTFVKEKMSKRKIIFGCEPSGHYYFRENYFIESPFIVLLKILAILSKTKKPLSELIKPFRKYYREELNIKKSVHSHIKEKTEEFSDWWFNIRASHTEPVIRLTIEARTKELLEKKKKELSKSIPFSS